MNSNGNLLCKDLKQHCLSSGLKKNTSAGIDCPVMNEKKLGEFSKGGKETESLLGNVLEIKQSLQISRRKKKSESHFKKLRKKNIVGNVTNMIRKIFSQSKIEIDGIQS